MLNLDLVEAFNVINDFISQVTQLLRAEFEELVDVARATLELIKLCDKK